MASSSFLYGYDLAIKAVLYSRFASILGIDTQHSSETENINEGIYQFPKAVAQRISAEKRGATFLEFMNFYRVGAEFSWERNRTPLSRRGQWVNTVTAAGSDTIHLKAVPVNLRYDVWFWSKDLDKINQIVEKYLFWQQETSKLSISYIDTYDNSYSLTPDLHFGEIIDESTVDDQYQSGLIYVHRMPITVDAWVFEGLSFKTISKIRVTFYDKDDVTNYSEIIVEDINQNTELEAALRFFRRTVYDIDSIDLTANSISIVGEFDSDFTAGDRVDICNSTDNNGTYTISSVGATYADNKTTVVLDGALTSSTADGTIYKR